MPHFERCVAVDGIGMVPPPGKLVGMILQIALVAGVLAATADRARAEGKAPVAGDLHARMSPTATATEYWEVAAQFETGHRFWARFLITNEGPGSYTGAAVGHLILPDGSMVPIKYGRTRDAWKLSPDGRELKVASAVLNLGAPTSFVEVDSDRRGIKLRIQFPREEALRPITPPADEYGIEAQLPVPAHASIWIKGMPAAATAAGTLAVTHTWMERSESDLLQHRDEVFARSGDVAVYFVALTRPDGQQRNWLGVRQGSHMRHGSAAAAIHLSAERKVADDAQYPVPQRWEAHETGTALVVQLQREWLRWDPLTVVPQPFHFLLALKAQPRRVWANASVDITLPPKDDQPGLVLQAAGIASVNFLRIGSPR